MSVIMEKVARRYNFDAEFKAKVDTAVNVFIAEGLEGTPDGEEVMAVVQIAAVAVHVAEDPSCLMRETSRHDLCPDGGTCHHGCQSSCLRVRIAGPLSGVFSGDRWPDEIFDAHAVTPDEGWD